MFNRVILIGRVGRDAEYRYAAGGDRVAITFTLATGKRYQDRTGEWQEDTQWHNIIFWGNRGMERICERLKKGALVLVEGEIRYRKWEDRNGNTRYTTEIYAFRVAPLEKRSAESQPSTEPSATDTLPPSEEELPQTGIGASEEETPQTPVDTGDSSFSQIPESDVDEELGTDDTKDDLPF